MNTCYNSNLYALLLLVVLFICYLILTIPISSYVGSKTSLSLMVYATVGYTKSVCSFSSRRNL